jgi:hypothetical protein
LQEMTGLQKNKMPPTQKKMCWWIALELVFVHSELKITNSSI